VRTLRAARPRRHHRAQIESPAKQVGASVWGNVAQTSTDAAYLSRHVGLRAGLAHESTALTVNRLCGSGFQAVVSASQELLAGEGTGIALVGGTESMSQSPLAAWGHTVRFGHKLGEPLALTDTLWSALTDAYCGTPMGITAENLAVKYSISRADADEYALRSQHAWAAAAKAGFFNGIIAPIEIKGSCGPDTVCGGGGGGGGGGRVTASLVIRRGPLPSLHLYPLVLAAHAPFFCARAPPQARRARSSLCWTSTRAPSRRRSHLPSCRPCSRRARTRPSRRATPAASATAPRRW
jgi:hypothetical protein